MNWKNVRKAELHVHLEGALTMDWAMMKAAQLPRHPWHGKSVDELTAEMDPHNFEVFLENFKNGVRLIRSQRDFQEVTEGLLSQLEEQGVEAAEILYSPGVSVQILDVALQDIHRGIQAGLKQFPKIQTCFILDTVLNLGPEFMERSLTMVLENRPDFLGGFSIGGGLPDIDLDPFLFLFEKAQRGGLFCVAHCGEIDRAENIGVLLRETDIKRIAHGVRAPENTEVLKLIVNKGIMIDVSLTSNLRTGAVSNLENHPIQIFKQWGIPFSINTDDPFYFQTNLENEYLLAENLVGTKAVEHAAQAALEHALNV